MTTVADKLASQRQKLVDRAKVGAHIAQETQGKDTLAKSVWFWNLLDFDRGSNIAWLAVYRVVLACTLTWNLGHPDQFWQGTQVAYDWVYGGV